MWRLSCICLGLAAALLQARRWPVEGILVSLEPEFRSVKVAHRPVPGLMPAMTMSFKVRDSAELRELRPGQRVRFELITGQTESIARKIRIVPPDEGDMPAPERMLRVGDPAPDFELLDQTGVIVRLSSLQGQVVALNFLYTRCPVPEVCPRLAASFAELSRRYGDRGLRLLSITVDPVHDTPEVLTGYAKLWRAQSDRWQFLTGTAESVARTGRDYGLVYWPEEGAVAHTSRTYVIGRDGRIAAAVEGTSFRADQLAGLVAHFLENKP